MQSALTEIAGNDILERLMARRDGDEIPAEELTRIGKETTVALGADLDASLVPGIKLEFAGFERLRSDAWIRALPPSAGLIAIASNDPEADSAAVMASVDLTSVVMLAAGALGGNPATGINVGDRALTGFEKDLLPLLGKAIAAPLEQMLPSDLKKFSGLPVSDFEPTTATGNNVIVLKYTVKFGEAAGGIAVAIPVDYFKTQRGKNKGHAAGSDEDPLASNVWNSRLRVQASIVLPSITLGKLKTLAVGDLVPIPAENFDRGTLTTRGRQIFAVQIGQVDDAFSFRVLHPVRKGSGFLHRVAESLSRAGQTKI